MSKYTEMSNQELMEELDWCGWDTYYDDYRRYIVAEIERRLNLTTIEIVRCEECKHWNKADHICKESKRYKPETMADHFCSYGERIEIE